MVFRPEPKTWGEASKPRSANLPAQQPSKQPSGNVSTSRPQQLGIAADADVPGHGGGQGLAPILGDRGVALDDAADEPAQVHLAEARAGSAALDLGDAQEGAEGVEHAVRLRERLDGL